MNKNFKLLRHTILYMAKYGSSLVLLFALRASHSLGRCSTTWAMPPVLQETMDIHFFNIVDIHFQRKKIPFCFSIFF
jgi:hypothetical protein